MNSPMSCSGGRCCMRGDALLGVEGIHGNSVTATGTGLMVRVETREDVTGDRVVPDLPDPRGSPARQNTLNQV